MTAAGLIDRVRRIALVGMAFACLVTAACLLPGCTSSMGDSGKIVFIEGEDYFDGPVNTLEGIGEKVPCSGGKSLYGYMLSRKGLVTRYKAPIASDMADCRLTLRYSRFHWYEQPRTMLKVTLADMDRVVSRQVEVEPTGGWGSSDSSQWHELEISLGQVPAGNYMLSLEAENKRHSDMNIDCMFLTDGPVRPDLSVLRRADRVNVNACRYVGLAIDRQVTHQKHIGAVEILCGAFSRPVRTCARLELITPDDQTLVLGHKTRLIIPRQEIALALSGKRFAELPDGTYALRLRSSGNVSLELPLELCGDFIDGFAERLAAVRACYDTHLAGQTSDSSTAYEADFRHALAYMAASYADLLEGKLNKTRLNNLRRVLAQYETTSDRLTQGRQPYAQRTGDLRFAFVSSATGKLEPYRVFLPASYRDDGASPCILALNHTEDKFLDQADGIIKRMADERGYVIISPAATSNYWGDGRKDLLEVVKIVLDRYPGIDQKRLYCTGTSRGGFGAYSLAADNEGMFAAIACSSGVGDRRFENDKWTWTRNLAKTPTLIFQGGIDNLVPTAWAQRIVEMLTEADIEHELHIYPSHGHSYEAYADTYFTKTLDFFDSHSGQ